ncbi:MAG: hypothetical protein P8X87_07430, partial [Candidatus Bathyarchaeota archaeon]
MNKKLLAIFGILCVISLLTVPMVSAKPTSAENNAKAVKFMWHSENGISILDEVKINPPSAYQIAPGVFTPDTKVTHTISSWSLNDTEPNANYVQIGDNDPIPILPSNYDATLYVQSQYRTPTHRLMNYRVYETIEWGDGNFIEIKCLERANLEILLDPQGNLIGYNFYASGTFSGHGVIDGQKVQVTGIREGSQRDVGFVLECYGTIRG